MGPDRPGSVFSTSARTSDWKWPHYNVLPVERAYLACTVVGMARLRVFFATTAPDIRRSRHRITALREKHAGRAFHTVLGHNPAGPPRSECLALWDRFRTNISIKSGERQRQGLGETQLTEAERQQFAAWNATQQDYPQATCVPQLVAAQSVATPNAVALAAGDQQLSYAELNCHANQVAHYLQALGVEQGTLVCCCVERSLDMVVALLGILKAGGAYVPLDPTYPRERLAFMLKDARAPVLITQRHLVSQFSPNGAHVLCLDSDSDKLATQSTLDPTSTVTENDLVYVIYTSGSTGFPKGVEITHRGLLNLLFWHHHAFAVTESDRATQLTSPAFDATGWELWPYLTIGASVYLPDEATRAMPELLRDWLVNQRITVTFLPTPLAERIMAFEWPSATSLRLLLTGADTLHRYPSPRLPFAVINNYGPTEATVVATSGLVPPTMAR